MPETLTPRDIRREIEERYPGMARRKIEHLVELFVSIANGKYVSGKRLIKEQRNVEIERLFDGVNYLELAAKFHLSIRQIRRLTKGKILLFPKMPDDDKTDIQDRI